MTECVLGAAPSLQLVLTTTRYSYMVPSHSKSQKHRIPVEP